MNSIPQRAVGAEASAIHVEPQAHGLELRPQVDGLLREVMDVPPKLQSEVLARLEILSSLDIAEKRLPRMHATPSGFVGRRWISVQVASLPTVFGEEMVPRMLDASSLEVDLTRLGFAPKILAKYEEVFRRPYGTISLTGTTGSGKSTTLYATLGELNSQEKMIITVEDPVELWMQGTTRYRPTRRSG